MKPYNTSHSKKEEVRTMFNAIAFRYDSLNHLLSMGIDRSWRRKVVRRIALSGAKTILDVATGTADLAILMARRLRQASITGVDLSEQMLSVGQQKVEMAGLQDRIHLIQGDAEHLPATEGSFDAATVAFGVRNFENIPQGISELFRVLRPGGTLCVLEFGIPHNPFFAPFYRFYFHKILPGIGKLISHDKDAYTYLPRSVDEFPYGQAFLELLGQAGFCDCSARNLWGGVAQIYTAIKPEEVAD